MTSRAIAVTGLLLILAVLLQTRAWAAEQECDRWLKLVDREVAERKEALGKKAGAARAKIEEALARTSGRVTEARAACRAGKDKTATLMAMELWDAFENTTKDPLAIHWHGLILPNGQDGVPYVTQSPRKPGERRLYDFRIVQGRDLLDALALRLPGTGDDDSPSHPQGPARPSTANRTPLIILNDFTTREAAAVLAELQGKGGKAMAGMGAPKRGPTTGMRMPEARGAPGTRDLNDV